MYFVKYKNHVHPFKPKAKITTIKICQESQKELIKKYFNCDKIACRIFFISASGFNINLNLHSRNKLAPRSPKRPRWSRWAETCLKANCRKRFYFFWSRLRDSNKCLKAIPTLLFFSLEPGRGFEPPTYSLRKSCSTTELSGRKKFALASRKNCSTSELRRPERARRLELPTSSYMQIYQLSGIPESNWRLNLGKVAYYHCTNPARLINSGRKHSTTELHPHLTKLYQI